jgi:hypothetical protein
MKLAQSGGKMWSSFNINKNFGFTTSCCVIITLLLLQKLQNDLKEELRLALYTKKIITSARQ